MVSLRDGALHLVLPELGGWPAGHAEQVSLLDVVSMLLILSF